MTTTAASLVLVVDDDDLARRALLRVMGWTRWRAVEARGIEEAIWTLHHQDFGIVLSDHDLEDTRDGIWLLAHTRAVRPGAIRALMSGRVPERVDQAVRAGVVEHFVQKPFSVTELEIIARVRQRN